MRVTVIVQSTLCSCVIRRALGILDKSFSLEHVRLHRRSAATLQQLQPFQNNIQRLLIIDSQTIYIDQIKALVNLSIERGWKILILCEGQKTVLEQILQKSRVSIKNIVHPEELVERIESIQ